MTSSSSVRGQIFRTASSHSNQLIPFRSDTFMNHFKIMKIMTIGNLIKTRSVSENEEESRSFKGCNNITFRSLRCWLLKQKEYNCWIVLMWSRLMLSEAFGHMSCLLQNKKNTCFIWLIWSKYMKKSEHILRRHIHSLSKLKIQKVLFPNVEKIWNFLIPYSIEEDCLQKLIFRSLLHNFL